MDTTNEVYEGYMDEYLKAGDKHKYDSNADWSKIYNNWLYDTDIHNDDYEGWPYVNRDDDRDYSIDEKYYYTLRIALTSYMKKELLQKVCKE